MNKQLPGCGSYTAYPLFHELSRLEDDNVLLRSDVSVKFSAYSPSNERTAHRYIHSLPRTVKSSGVLSLWKCKTSEHYASEKKGEGVGEKIWHKTWFSILWSLALGVLWSTGAQEKLQKKLSGIDLHLKTFFVHTSIPIAWRSSLLLILYLLQQWESDWFVHVTWG